MDATTRAALELLYNQLLSLVVLLAHALNKECPVETRKERRQRRAA